MIIIINNPGPVARPVFLPRRSVVRTTFLPLLNPMTPAFYLAGLMMLASSSGPLFSVPTNSASFSEAGFVVEVADDCRCDTARRSSAAILTSQAPSLIAKLYVLPAPTTSLTFASAQELTPPDPTLGDKPRPTFLAPFDT